MGLQFRSGYRICALSVSLGACWSNMTEQAIGLRNGVSREKFSVGIHLPCPSTLDAVRCEVLLP